MIKSIFQARENELDENSEDYGIARLLKANIYNQLGRYVEAAAEAQIILKLFPKPKNEPQLCPSALFELGNSFRLQGSFFSDSIQKLTSEISHKVKPLFR